ncbi:MAG: hypothetical protein ACK54P_17180, partial [Bacteroidota bacterium]
PVTAQAFEFNRPAVVGFGLNPVPANASAGFDPTLVCMELEKSMVADGGHHKYHCCQEPS